MTSNHITVERIESFAIVRFNRPEKLNALTREMKIELARLLRGFDTETDLRAIIITGSGRAFCAGTDIAEVAVLDEDAAVDASRTGQEMSDAAEQCRVPVIAAINGIAAGGGCEFALACHIRIASADAVFSVPEIKLGIMTAYGASQRLPRIIGTGRAHEMILTGRSIDAEQAFAVGLVNRVVEPDRLLDESLAVAREIAALSPTAIRACLEAVIGGSVLPLVDGLKLETELFSRLFATEDMREGTSAFLEKRAPKFVGR